MSDPSQHALGAYAKDAGDEDFLRVLGERLAGFETERYRELEETHPTVHVLGMPRSGTTLANQLIAAHTSIAYIDHIAAAFPRAPVTGLRLSQKLRRGEPLRSTFGSDFGRTGALEEPHEFTYFFSDLFGLPTGVAGLAQPAADHVVDWPRVGRILTNLCDAAAGPIVFKAFHVVWQLPQLCATLPRTVVVRIRRDRISTGLSLLRMRETLYGDRATWASLRPREADGLADADWATQIAGQIVYGEVALGAGLTHVAPGGLVDVDYAELCAAPGAFLSRVVEAVRAQGGAAELVGEPPASFPVREPATDTPDARALSDALAAMDARVAGA